MQLWGNLALEYKAWEGKGKREEERKRKGTMYMGKGQEWKAVGEGRIVVTRVPLFLLSYRIFDFLGSF